MMFAKLTALFAIATVAVASPVPQDPLDPILSIVESIIDGALPTAVVPIGGLPAIPTDAAGISSVLNELSSVLAELPVPTGLAGILPLDAEKRDVNVPAVPTGTVNALAGPAPTAELLKPTGMFPIYPNGAKN
ncbi:hypothetical protein C8Q79DRAFT_989606 [Trametes meyenii]|nr:hypothetical protein C8Q79DRAFT_989606 [Trametes meyenii]